MPPRRCNLSHPSNKRDRYRNPSFSSTQQGLVYTALRESEESSSHRNNLFKASNYDNVWKPVHLSMNPHLQMYHINPSVVKGYPIIGSPTEAQPPPYPTIGSTHGSGVLGKRKMDFAHSSSTSEPACSKSETTQNPHVSSSTAFTLGNLENNFANFFDILTDGKPANIESDFSWNNLESKSGLELEGECKAYTSSQSLASLTLDDFFSMHDIPVSTLPFFLSPYVPPTALENKVGGRFNSNMEEALEFGGTTWPRVNQHEEPMQMIALSSLKLNPGDRNLNRAW